MMSRTSKNDLIFSYFRMLHKSPKRLYCHQQFREWKVIIIIILTNCWKILIFSLIFKFEILTRIYNKKIICYYLFEKSNNFLTIKSEMKFCHLVPDLAADIAAVPAIPYQCMDLGCLCQYIGGKSKNFLRSTKLEL